MLRFQFHTLVRSLPETVLAFHQREDAINLLTPWWQPMQVLSREGGLEVGGEVRFRVWMGPLPVIWVARHTEFRGAGGFTDEQLQGPFRYWRHQHRFEPHANGTLLVDDITCSLPLAPLSHWLGGWLLHLQLHVMFRHRHKVTKRHCENSVSSV